MITTGCDVQKRSVQGLLTDLRILVKGFVPVANVLPILTGYWLALYFAEIPLSAVWDKLIYLLIGGTLIISGALMLNNWYEVDLDSKMERTQIRPTVTGNFSLRTVLLLGIITSTLGFAVLFFASTEAAAYGFLGWFTYVVLYTFWTKRKYTLNTVVGSISGAFTPLIGWAAVTSAYHIVPIVLFIILFIWQIPHTFAIAMRRHDEYKAANVPMLPVIYGFTMTKRQTAIYIACLLPLPLFLISVGIGFVAFISLVALIWLTYAVHGLFTKENQKYADRMFYLSLLYMTALFGGIIVITLPFFQ